MPICVKKYPEVQAGGESIEQSFQIIFLKLKAHARLRAKTVVTSLVGLLAFSDYVIPKG